MHARGFLNLLFFYSVWVGSCLVYPVVIFAAAYGYLYPLYILLGYYGYRWLRPATTWSLFRKAICVDGRPYCRTTQVVLTDGACVPKPREKVITTVAPHGILTLGWSLLNSCELYLNSETTFLVAPAMMKLPFIGDIMRWTNCSSCDPANMARVLGTGVNVALIPGGFQEATIYKRGKYRVFLKSKKGFIKVLLSVL